MQLSGQPSSFGQMPCELKQAHTYTTQVHVHTQAHKHTPHLPPGLSPSSYRCVLVWRSTPLVLQFCALVRRPEGCVWVHLDRQCADHNWTHTCYCQVDIRCRSGDLDEKVPAIFGATVTVTASLPGTTHTHLTHTHTYT